MRGLAQGHEVSNEKQEDWFSQYHNIIKPYIPQYLGNTLQKWQDPNLPAITPMLSAMRAAAEAYLQVSLNTTDLAISTKLSVSDPTHNLLNQDLGSLGLRRTLGGFPSALEAAVYASHMSRDHSYISNDDDPRLILAVDCSRSALTVGLFIDQDDVLDSHRFLQDLSIGADASPFNVPWRRELLIERRLLLQKVASLPIENVGCIPSGEIQELVVLGDFARDGQLLALLEEVVGTGLVETVRRTAQADSIDPIFAAAKGMAFLAKQKIDEGEGSCLPWDCKGWWDRWMGL